MKKIDLHTHTIPTISDADFNFSLPKLLEYIDKLKIDALAITNHNTFDLEQYYEIKNSASIPIFPGIEIDLENGHLLIIADIDEFEVTDFENKCSQVSKLVQSNSDYLNLSDLNAIFTDLGKYLLIPHYDKIPSLKPDVIKSLNSHITSGEVSSVSKFKRMLKDNENLTPVLFSDVRFSTQLVDFPTRHTFVDLREITLTGIKSCLADKNKVSLTRESGNEFFQATDDGLELSTGLNIILGERSSGKTVTLDKIAAASENVKYIKQFSLLQNDEETFNKKNDSRLSIISNNYLDELKSLIEDVVKIDLTKNNQDVESYLNSLKTYARENEKKDLYSKCTLFSEEAFIIEDYKNLDAIINSIIIIIDNTEYKHIIDKHISPEVFRGLLSDLVKEAIKLKESNEKKRWLNSILSDIQRELRIKTTSTFIENVDLYKIAIENKKIEKFELIISNLKKEEIINIEELGKFSVITTSNQIESASDLQKIGYTKRKYSSAFSHYNSPYNYLLSLKEINIEEAELYKFFVKVESKTLNEDGFKVSGGERSEFNLIHEIKDATKYDMLLIDEPESSFDNLFLKKEINTLIKDISRLMPVIVVTHNNTVGASIKPNYIAITQKSIENSKVVYRVYTGYPSDKELTSSDGATIQNYEAILNCLEAGIDAYTERNTQTYEILKN